MEYALADAIYQRKLRAFREVEAGRSHGGVVGLYGGMGGMGLNYVTMSTLL